MDSDIVINLYKKQYKFIYLYLIKCGCSKSDAEDIIQDSFIKAIEYMEHVEKSKLSSWLFQVALNKYRNKIKRNKIISAVSVNEENFYEHLVSEDNIEEGFLVKEKNKQVREVLNNLKDETKSVLIFKYDMELSYREIGLLLGLSEDSVKTYLYRARKKYKEEWNKINEGYR